MKAKGGGGVKQVKGTIKAEIWSLREYLYARQALDPLIIAVYGRPEMQKPCPVPKKSGNQNGNLR